MTVTDARSWAADDAVAVEVAGLRSSLTASRVSLENAVQRMVASVSGDDLAWAADDEIAETLLVLVDLTRRLDALKGDVATRVKGGNTFAEAGFRTASAWLRSRTNESFAGVKRTLVSRAALLGCRRLRLS